VVAELRLPLNIALARLSNPIDRLDGAPGSVEALPLSVMILVGSVTVMSPPALATPPVGRAVADDRNDHRAEVGAQLWSHTVSWKV